MSAEAVRAGEDGAADVGESGRRGSGSGSASATAASTAAIPSAPAPNADTATAAPAGTPSAAPRPEFPGSNDLDASRPPDGHTLTRVSTNPQPPPPPPSSAAATKPAAATLGATTSSATPTSHLTAVSDHIAVENEAAAASDDPASPASSSAHAVPAPLAALQNLVGPSTFLRPAPRPAGYPMTREESQASAQSISALDREQIEGLRAIRAFLKVRTAYDVLPLSYRLIVFDTSLLVKKSLNALTQCAIVSAPLWDSKTSTFAGMLTTTDYLNVVQYYWQYPDALQRIDQFRLDSLREIERAIGVSPIETVSTHPLTSLYEACRRMLASRARRIPLVDVDDETQRPMVVSVITQYRILKFVTINVGQTQMLRKPLRELRLGTYTDLVTCSMDTPVIDVVHQLVRRSISCVPILASDGVTVLNVFEAVDVIACIKGGDYENLSISVGKAIDKRPEDFPGIYTCTPNDRLDTIFETIRRSRVHRLVIIDDAQRLQGVLSLSDILDYTLNSPLGDEDDEELQQPPGDGPTPSAEEDDVLAPAGKAVGV